MAACNSGVVGLKVPGALADTEPDSTQPPEHEMKLTRTEHGANGIEPGVPPQALLLSLLSLWVPVLSSSFFPEWTSSDVGILVWLLALVPAFLLSYYRGWKGTSVALAGGMVAFTAAQIWVSVSGAGAPSPDIMLGAIIVLVSVSLGSGLMSSLLRRSLSRAERLAMTDTVTGLANRRHAMDYLARAFARAERGREVSVVLFDLDRFKVVNDEQGHAAGDRVLADFGRILHANTRAMDLSARFGGEEFLTVLADAGCQEAARFAERVRQTLEEHDYAWGTVTVSAGVAAHEAGMASPEVLVAAADQALYRAKQEGRNRVVQVGRKGRSPVGSVRLGTVPAAESGQGSELILLVDDDAAVLRTVAMALRRRGYRVLESEHPARALEIARGLDAPLDLVVTDVVMPEMSGFRFVEMLARQQPDVRALYISGYGRQAVEWAGVPGSIRAFLSKPFTVDELTGAVRRTLDASGETTRVAPDRDDDGHGFRPRVRPPSPGGNGSGPAGPSRTATDTDRLQARMEAQSAQLQEAYAELLLRLARAAEYRDDATSRHAERVGILAGLLAEEMGLDDEFAARLTIAAPLHDIGKIAVPDAILNKPGGLTPAERAIMDEHCEHGAELLSGSSNEWVREAERIARSHHERWDGAGYPDGLTADEIPLAARITAVADAFDSLTNMRPYRAPRSWRDALEVIRQERGGQFDPDVVDALNRLAEAGRLLDKTMVPVFGTSQAAVSGGGPADACGANPYHAFKDFPAP